MGELPRPVRSALPLVSLLLLPVLSGCDADSGPVPELDRPATSADRSPAEWGIGAGVIPSSARLVGSVDGADVFVGIGASPRERRPIWAPDPGHTLQHCLLIVADDGMTTSCGRLPIRVEPETVDAVLVGVGVEAADGYRLLGSSVLVAD